MTIDTTAAPGAAASTAAPAFPANDQGLANPADTSTEQPQGGSAPETEQDKTRRKLERRVGTVTRQRYEAEARANQHAQEAERLRAEVAQLRQSRSQPAGDGQTQGDQGRQQQPQDRGLSQEDIDRRVNERADQVARQREVNARSNQVLQEGIKAFGEDFRQSVATVLEEAGDFVDRRTGAPTALLEAVLDADNPSVLLNHLGQNPDDAAELRGLGPAALGRRIAKLEAQLAAAPAPQSTPVHKPVQGSATARAKPADQMSDAEWHRQRQEQRAKR